MKKSIFEIILDFFAPNYCYFCGKLGDLVCNNCTNAKNFKIRTKKSNSKNRPSREFYLGNLEGDLSRMLDGLKFQNKKENARAFAEILAFALSKSDFIDSKNRIILIPAPTSEKHIRTRGFAHSELISKELARILGVKNEEIIARKANFVQKGSSAKMRKIQAEKSYFLCGEIQKDAIYVIFDDVRTTGSTINSISKILFDAGAREVWALYLMSQELK